MRLRGKKVPQLVLPHKGKGMGRGESLPWCGFLTWPVVWRDGIAVDIAFFIQKILSVVFWVSLGVRIGQRYNLLGAFYLCFHKMFIKMHITAFPVSQCENTTRSFPAIVRSFTTCTIRRVWFIGHAELFPRNKILPNRFRHKVLAAQMAKRAWLGHVQGVIPSQQSLPTSVQKKLGVSPSHWQLWLWNAHRSVWNTNFPSFCVT